eukprot:jgi/Astpho2/7436/Aster-x1434
MSIGLSHLLGMSQVMHSTSLRLKTLLTTVRDARTALDIGAGLIVVVAASGAAAVLLARYRLGLPVLLVTAAAEVVAGGSPQSCAKLLLVLEAVSVLQQANTSNRRDVEETDSRLLSPARQANAQGPGNFSSVHSPADGGALSYRCNGGTVVGGQAGNLTQGGDGGQVERGVAQRGTSARSKDMAEAIHKLEERGTSARSKDMAEAIHKLEEGFCIGLIRRPALLIIVASSPEQ